MHGFRIVWCRNAVPKPSPRVDNLQLGTCVGCGVGITVGTTVGNGVVAAVGDTVGATDGVAVGDGVGTTVGDGVDADAKGL